jgi:hypothetical protein
MRVYIITGDDLMVSRKPPAEPGENEIVVASLDELHAARLSGKRLLALWNGLPGVDRVSKVGDHEALVDRLWSALEALPDPQPVRPSKQTEVIALLRRPAGATVDEVRAATGWQPHTVRGVFSGGAGEEARARGGRDQGGARPGVPHRRGGPMTPVPQSTGARQETGGPSRCQHLATGRQAEGADIEARIIALEALTTASMGRLTLNVLLSFAQFEREVTGERIRDKIAASKKKGMWMGGVPPLGYRVGDRKLVVVEHEAETVRHIFRRYAALGSVRLLKTELEAHRIAGKSWTSASGRS